MINKKINTLTYRNNPAFSQSDLKIFSKNGLISLLFDKFNLNKSEIKKSYLEFGTGVHCAALEPQLFEDTYLDIICEKPTSIQMETFANNIIQILKDISIDDIVSIYSSIYSIKGQTKDNIINKAQNLYKSLETYISIKKEGILKNIEYSFIKPEEKVLYRNLGERIRKAISIIENEIDKKTAHISIEKKDIFIEQELFSCYNELLIKGKPDFYKIVTGKSYNSFIMAEDIETHCTLIDLKTTSNDTTTEFTKTIQYLKYIEQLGFYNLLIENNHKVSNEIFNIDYYIITCLNTTPYTVKIFRINNDYINKGKKEILNTLDNLISLLKKYELLESINSIKNKEDIDMFYQSLIEKNDDFNFEIDDIIIKDTIQEIDFSLSPPEIYL